FNNAMIRDVMVENPQAAKSEEVTEVLDNRTDPLPAYMRWQINNGLYHFSEKEIMEQFMHLQKSRHDLALNEIIRGIIHQSEGFELAPSLDELLAPVNDIRYQYLRAEFQFAQGDYVAGMQLLNSIAQQFPIDTDEALQAHQEKINFYTLLAQWDNDDYPGFTNLPEDVLTQVETYLEAHPRVAGKALSLLMLNQAIEYEELILYPTEEMLPKSGAVSPNNDMLIPEMEHEFRFSLFPNPSRDYLTLDWCIESPRKAETGKIEIRNASGVLVHTLATRVPCNQQILPLNDWKSGTYTATIQLDGNMRKSITFVVAQ
ncbi:MAG: T9SS type A sorting domain-containing protein, partial [Bacteroidales bacterium]